MFERHGQPPRRTLSRAKKGDCHLAESEAVLALRQQDISSTSVVVQMPLVSKAVPRQDSYFEHFLWFLCEAVQMFSGRPSSTCMTSSWTHS